MANKVTIVINADGTAAIENIQKTSGAIEGLSNSAASAAQKTKSATETIKTAWLEVYAKIELAKQVWDFSKEMVKLYAEEEQAMRGFKMVAQSFGADADSMLASWKRATHGMIDEGDLARQGMRGMLLGLKDDMGKINEMVRPAAIMSGQDPSQVLASLTTAFGAGVRALGPLVAQYGLLTKETFQLLQEAANLGVKEADLVKVAYNEAIIMGERMKLGQLDHLEQMHKMTAAMNEIKETIGAIIQKIMVGLSGVFAGVGALANGVVAEVLKPFDYLQRGINWTMQQLGKNWQTNVWKDARENAEAARDQWGANAKRYMGLTFGILPSEGKQTDAERAASEARIAKLQADNKKLIDNIRSQVNLAKNRDKDDGTAALLAFQKQMHALNPDLDDFQRRIQQLDDTFKELEKRGDKAGWSKEIMQGIKDAFGQGKSYLEQTKDRDEYKKAMEASAELQRMQLEFSKSYADIGVTESARRANAVTNQEKDMLDILSDLYSKGGVEYEEYERRKMYISQSAAQERLKIQQDALNAEREAALKTALNQVDIAEQSHEISKTEAISRRLELSQELLKQQEAYLSSIDKAKDAAAWYAQSNAIDDTRKNVLKLNEALREQTGTLGEGIKEGLRRYIEDMRSAFQNGVYIVESFTRGAESALETFFDYASDGFMNFRKLVTSILNDIYKAIVRTMVIQPLMGGITSALGGLFQSATSSLIGTSPQAWPKFAGGGIAYRPSIFGEAGPEAAVPLPDGRRIPVDLRGSAQGVNLTINVENRTDKAVQAQQGRVAFDGEQYVVGVILKNIEQGGALRSVLGGK